MADIRKLAAILCSDVVGYSRLAGADEDRILARLRALRSDLIDPTIAIHHGRIVKRTGDGSIVEFRSVVDAVRCAIEVQTAMVERNAGVPEDRRIVFRIGIHIGDVVEEADGDLMGDGVNIAARLEGVAKPGTICLSEDAYRQVKGRLDLAVTDLGQTQLKNIAEPIRVYLLQVGIAAQAKSVMEARPTRILPRGNRLVPLATVIMALLILTAAGAWYFLSANRPAPAASNAPAPVVPRLSIVVLPFVNLSGDPAQDYLADALTDELTTSLARIRNSFVIARNTAFTYKGKPVDAKAIGKDLGVRYALEGSVQPNGSAVRVNAQLVAADSGGQLWAEQFDTTRADLLQAQDEIVVHLVRALEIQLLDAEAVRLKRTPAVSPDAEDLALQCTAAMQQTGYIGKEADAGFAFCERALAIDANNVRSLTYTSLKFLIPVVYGRSADPKADLERSDELVSQAILLDPNFARGHMTKATLLWVRGRLDESIAEGERALALDPAMVEAHWNIGIDYLDLGEFEKSLDFFDKAIRLSPRDPNLGIWFQGKERAYFGLKQYDQAIELGRRSIAINANKNPYAHADLIAAFALTDRVAEAREALQRYLSIPSFGPTTIMAWKGRKSQFTNPRSDPRYLELWDRTIEGLRKAGMPEE
jgi:adenylate cyclase